MVNGVLALSMVFLLTRTLTSEQYGGYALGIAVIGSGASILFQWIAVTVSRFYSAHSSNPGGLIAEGKKLFFLVSIIPLILTVAVVVFPQKINVNPIFAIITCIGILAAGVHNLCLQVANASGQPLRYGILTVSRNIISGIAAIILIQFNYGELGAICGAVIGTVLSVTFFSVRHRIYENKRNSELRSQLVNYGLPLTVTFFSTMMLDVSDRFIIAWFLGKPAVAGYAAAYDLTQQTIGALLNVLFLVSYPRITAAWESSGVLGARLAMTSLSQAMLLAIPLLAAIFTGGATLISNVILGPTIRDEAATLTPLIAFAITVGCFKNFYLDIAFQLVKKTNTILKISITMAIVNLLLNVFLIPIFGVIGAAAATAVAVSFGALLSWWFGRRIHIYSICFWDGMRMLFVFTAVILAMQFAPTSEYGNLQKAIISIAIALISYSLAIFLIDLANIRQITKIKIKTFMKYKSNYK